jgi:hypothetical protein
MTIILCAIAFLIAEGWEINLAQANKEIPGGLTANDWLNIANHCLGFVNEKLAENKIIPISRFRK